MAALLIVLLLLAGCCRAVADAIAHQGHRLLSRGPFWDDRTSWQRKYRDYPADLRPAFWGATTVFVAFTDGWHLFNALTWLCADAAFMLAAWPGYHWYAVVAVLARRIAFEPLYAFLKR